MKQKSLIWYMTIALSALIFSACGNQRDSERNVIDTADRMDPYETPVPPLDTLRRDSTDTLGQPLPTTTPPITP